jgi:hypothetical protein
MEDEEKATPPAPVGYREALIRVRAHTSYVNPTMELLQGLLASIERIADAALRQSPAPPAPVACGHCDGIGFHAHNGSFVAWCGACRQRNGETRPAPPAPVEAKLQRYFVKAERYIGYGIAVVPHPNGGWMLATEVERYVAALRSSRSPRDE